MGDEENLYELYQGCPLHGEEFMRECSVCGGEYCAQCFPASGVCPNCSAEVDDDELDEDPDFSDVDDLDTLIGEDDEAEDVIRESDEQFPGGF
ncbi:MAG: hypothetical protein PHP44_01810 [Kiritimatiellae bacterium]|nr:hypothetical protein [Kiritimatiellia bacterium]MDD4734822.1 hypothetical protein [Kiritimatiellia bacterium]